jgi:hypothetical protein
MELFDVDKWFDEGLLKESIIELFYYNYMR